MASPLRRRWVRWTLGVLVTLAVLYVVGPVVIILTTDWIAHAVADAPNHGRREIAVTPAEELSRRGVDEAFAVDVSPQARLSVWAMDPEPPETPDNPATPAADTRGTIVVLHGIRDRKKSMTGFGRAFAQAGYHVLLVDLRGHGESTGDWLSYGALDAGDLERALDEAERRGLAPGPVGVFGPSYGGSCAILWSARDPRIKAVVTAATFSSLRDVVPEYSKRFLPWTWRLVPRSRYNAQIDRAGKLGGFNPDEASPIDAIARGNVPILLIHGTADVNIPSTHSRALHAAAPNHSQLLLVDGADHTTLFAGGQVKTAALEWFEQRLR